MITPLFCKPHSQHGILFSKFVPELNNTVSFRSLDLKNDLEAIYVWVHMLYARDYWQMTGPYSQLFAQYQCIASNPFCHSFAGLLGEQLICQLDLYSIQIDELKSHIPCSQNDCGFRLLMAPNQTPISGLTLQILKTFLEYFFSFAESGKMFAEPDVRNAKSIALLERCGFQRLQTITMTYKTAHIYCLEK